MHFGKRDPEEDAVKQIRSGVKEFEDTLAYKEKELSELFVQLKDDILTSQNLDVRHVDILRKQVRHILSVARAIGYKELESAFEQEEVVLNGLEKLLERYPEMDVSSSADMQSSLRNLQSMLKQQQELIFRHKEIMSQEKRRLIQILQEAEQLEKEIAMERSLKPSDVKLLH